MASFHHHHDPMPYGHSDIDTNASQSQNDGVEVMTFASPSQQKNLSQAGGLLIPPTYDTEEVLLTPALGATVVPQVSEDSSKKNSVHQKKKIE